MGLRSVSWLCWRHSNCRSFPFQRIISIAFHRSIAWTLGNLQPQRNSFKVFGKWLWVKNKNPTGSKVLGNMFPFANQVFGVPGIFNPWVADANDAPMRNNHGARCWLSAHWLSAKCASNSLNTKSANIGWSSPPAAASLSPSDPW